MRKLLPAAFLFVALSAAAAPAPAKAPQHLTLERAIERAVSAATLVQKSQNNVAIAGADLLQAYGNFLPNLGARASYGLSSGTTLAAFNGVNLVDTRYHGADFLISSSLNLFNGLADTAALDSALRRKSAANLSLERARQQIALDVTQAYLQAALDQELVRIAEKNLQVSQERLKLFRARQKLGSLAAADSYRQEAQAASDQSTLIDARNRASLDTLYLLQRLRVDARENYVLDPPRLRAPASRGKLPDVDGLVDVALRERADLRARQDETGAAAADVTRARSGYFPVLDLTGTYGGLGRDYTRVLVNGESRLPQSQRSLWAQLGDQDTAALTLELRWDLFSRFATRNQVVRASAAESNARLDEEDQGNLVVVEVKQAYVDYTAAFDQLAAAEAGVQAAQKAFELISGRYKLGASSYLDLTTSQAALAQSQAVRAQALVNFALRERALNFSLGRDPKPLEP